MAKFISVERPGAEPHMNRLGKSTENEYSSKVKVLSEKSTRVQVKVHFVKKYSGKSKSIFKSTQVFFEYF